jgi:hypothetical protein
MILMLVAHEEEVFAAGGEDAHLSRALIRSNNCTRN